MLEKRVEHAFGKNVYLLGKTKDGDVFWLESASWACKWYWGFGYVETYTNANNPHTSRDINSHQHFNGLLGKQKDGSYLHHINEILEDSVLSDDESWKLSELMRCFYILTEAAELFHRGGSHLTTNPIHNILKDKGAEDNINNLLLPAIFKEVYAILIPTEGE